MAGELVSIIVPTFNRAYCLARTMDSALAQTHASLEILLVDDGSTDGTRDLVREAYSREPRVKYLHQKNQGVSAARNAGLRAAQGDHIAFLDSDDVWKPWKLQVQVACMNCFPAIGMVWSDMEAVGPDGKLVSTKYLRTMYEAYRWFRNDQLFAAAYPLSRIAPRVRECANEGSVFVGDIFSQMIMGSLVHTSTVLLRRERLDKVRGFSEELRLAGEDYDFHLRTCREGPVAFIDLPSIQYQTGMPDRLSRHTPMVALNCLKTLEPILIEDRERISLPRKMIRQVLADTHAWAGEELFEIGDSRNARRHLARSLLYKPWQPRVWALGTLAGLPRRAGRALRTSYRWLKSRFVHEPQPLSTTPLTSV